MLATQVRETSTKSRTVQRFWFSIQCKKNLNKKYKIYTKKHIGHVKDCINTYILIASFPTVYHQHNDCYTMHTSDGGN